MFYIENAMTANEHVNVVYFKEGCTMAPSRKQPRPPSPLPARTGGMSGQGNLHEEINTLREIIRQVSRRIDEATSLQETLHLLEAISRSGSRLANMLKTQHVLDGGETQTTSLSEPLKEILADMTKNLRT